MESYQYIYNVKYPFYEKDLCALEVKALFNHELEDKVFFENIKVNPSVSPFLKNRLKIMYRGVTFADVLNQITAKGLNAEDFKVKYVQLFKNEVNSETRRKCCKEIGLIIEGEPSYSEAKIVFGITSYENKWYFGPLTESDPNWKVHNNKPFSYSSSLGINTAKALVNIAGNGDLSKRLVDPCCGVGTVLIEGEYAGYTIKGWEINWKVAKNARRNLKHFHYDTTVTTGDIKDITELFDTAIIDLPYGNFSKSNQEDKMLIIKNAKRISNKVVIVSAEDISEDLISENLTVIDSCKIGKNRISDFTRYIWVCE